MGALPLGGNWIEPMTALRASELPPGDWICEMKFDGYRALAFKAGSEVRLFSRNRTLGGACVMIRPFF